MREQVRLEYLRPPDRTTVFEQELVYADDDVSVTYLAQTPLPRPVIIDGRPVLEAGAPAVWFTFPRLMHDIGRFHTVDGTFTGLYANVILPVEMRTRLDWRATDLFVDVWVGIDGKPQVLDLDELAEAMRSNWVTVETAAAARTEAERIIQLHAEGSWPPVIVNEWTLERVLSS